MKKIGLLSDTHGYWDKRYQQYFAECDEIWHAGDIGSMEIAEKLSELSTGQSDTRGFNRFMLAGAVEVDVDSLGRILVPDFLKEFADLGQKVVITGVHNRAEIWNEEKWIDYKKKIVDQADSLAEKLGEIGVF